MIKNLLAYQEKDKERLALLLTVETSRVKRELDAAARALDESRANLLALENDAKSLTAAYESTVKNLKEIFDRIEQYEKTANTSKSEDELQSASTYIAALLQKVTGYESQLDNLTKQINAKTAAFENTRNAVAKAQGTVKNYNPEYQRQRAAIQPKVDEIEAEMKKMEADIDRPLLEKYKSRRRSDKSGKVTDIAVKMLGDKCGGCYCEMPLLLTHKIKTDGYIVCESCGKIIYI